MENREKIVEWLDEFSPHIEWAIERYEMLSQEHRIWFWIVAVLVSLSVLSAAGYVIYRIIRGLNTLLQSPQGWRPIRFISWMWVGSGIWLLFVAHSMRMEEVPAWSVALVSGILTILGFVWFMYSRLKFLRGTGATLVNSSIGLVVAPVVIHSLILVIVLIVGCIFLWIYASFNSRRVVYLE